MHDRHVFEHQQRSTQSPWTRRERLAILAWHFAWPLLCGWTPKPLNRWRLFVLRLFGATIRGAPFVHQRARVQLPWNLTLEDGASLGDRANAYSLGPISIARGATIAQEAYLCTGTHAFERDALNLIVAPITVGEHAFVGARALVLPGVSIGARSVVGAGALVTRDVPDGAVVVAPAAEPLVRR